MRISEGKYPITEDHSDHRIGAMTMLVNLLNRFKNILNIQRQFPVLGQFMGKDIQKDLRIRFCVQVSEILLE